MAGLFSTIWQQNLSFQTAGSSLYAPLLSMPPLRTLIHFLPSQDTHLLQDAPKTASYPFFLKLVKHVLSSFKGTLGKAGRRRLKVMFPHRKLVE